jgi:carbamoyl-phosphate synthase/aspartate carbamoyltransferase/dihydroorotase
MEVKGQSQPAGEPKASPWRGRHVLSVKQFDRQDLDHIFTVAHEMRDMVARQGGSDLLKGRILANMFYEPSTRTSCSFMAAMQRLGGQVIPINEAKTSSVAKGETIGDTAATLGCYADVIVIRNPEVGSAALAAEHAGKPVLNAGDGAGEHPTQALLDTFTIREELGRLDDLNVTLLGDLKYGRTVHSLARLLTRFSGIKLNYVSPPILRMPKEVVDEVSAAGVTQTEHETLDEVLPDTDVLYVTRIQRERFEDPAQYEEVKDAFVITPETLARAKQKMALMHPLPRVNEIAVECDDDPRAAYFRQMEYGMYVRMALLALVLGKA